MKLIPLGKALFACQLCKHSSLSSTSLLFMQKVNERKAALEKMQFTENGQNEKWKKVLTIGYLSSEESGMDDENEVIIVKHLPWRSSYVNQMFNRLDEKAITEKSPQSRRQMKKRVTGEASARSKPAGEIPPWAVPK